MHFDNEPNKAMIDLYPDREPEELIDALFEARRSNRIDLAPQVGRLLAHDAPMVREEAISLLATKWALTEWRTDILELLKSDPDFGVRSRAASGLANLSSSSTRHEDLAVLVGVVRNVREETVVRQSCLESIAALTGQKGPDDTGSIDTSSSVVARLLRLAQQP